MYYKMKGEERDYRAYFYHRTCFYSLSFRIYYLDIALRANACLNVGYDTKYTLPN